MPTGTIARIPLGKTYGFIKKDSDKYDYFFHRDDYVGDWDDLVIDFQANEDIKVQFNIVESVKGSRAGNVRRV